MLLYQGRDHAINRPHNLPPYKLGLLKLDRSAQ
jgi:hypothetical protein